MEYTVSIFIFTFPKAICILFPPVLLPTVRLALRRFLLSTWLRRKFTSTLAEAREAPADVTRRWKARASALTAQAQFRR